MTDETSLRNGGGGAGQATPAGPAALEQGHPRKWWILAAVSLGMFMTLLDITIVNIAIPAILEDLHTTVTQVSWVINAYSLTLAVLFLSMGGLADRFGRKFIFLSGLLVFTLFSLLCGLAPSIEWLVAFRVGQGVGGAAMAPISLAILMSVFPRRQHGMAVGLWGALGTVAAAVGPSLGGVLIEYISWHWVFFINVPVGVVALVLCWWVVPRAREKLVATRFDVLGVVISAIGLFCLVLALIQATEWGWGSAPIIGLFVAAAVSAFAFGWWEQHTSAPMFDFRLLRIRSFTAANGAMVLIGATLGGAMFLLVIFLVAVLGYSELKAAIAITPMPVVALVLAPIVGRLTDRIGPRLPAATGAAFFGVGMLLLAQLGGDSTLLDTTWRVLFVGAGMGFVFPSVASAAMSSLPPAVAGVGSGALNTLRQIGFSLGVAILVTIFTSQMTANIANASRDAQRFVDSQTALPAAARAQIDMKIQQSVAQAQGGGTLQANSVVSGAPSAAPGSPQAQEQAKLTAGITTIFKDNIAKSFQYPYYVAALAAFAAIIPALFTGRRLGEHAGHHELTRAERATERA
jgi:EmrB/QacA subfamily drug resistance transporter